MTTQQVRPIHERFTTCPLMLTKTFKPNENATTINLIRQTNPLLTAMLFMVSVFAPLMTAAPSAFGDEPAVVKTPEPTLKDVRYGKSARHKLHFWKAESNQPTAVVFHIHGGGWNGGERLNKNLLPVLPKLLKAKISVVSVEYRLIRHAVALNVFPPVKAPIHDCAHALQFVRSKAKQWNFDPDRIAVFGGSAGACTCLWLAFHDDLADPNSDDPIARMSTRPNFAAVLRAQTTLDPVQMKAWIPNGFYGGHAFGINKPGKENREINVKEFLARRDELLTSINEYSPYALASKDAPPVYMYYRDKPAIGKKAKDPTHSANYGVQLHEHLKLLGVQTELVYPGAPDVVHATAEDYLIDVLK